MEESKGGLHGIKVCHNAPPVSYLLYVGDHGAVQKCFDKYCDWSRQAINLEKLSIFFSKNTRGLDKANVNKVFAIKEMQKESIYLGNNMIFGRGKIKDFKGLKD